MYKTNLYTQPLITNPSLLKQINYARILELLRCFAPITRAELARCTGLTRSTVTVITAELIAAGLIKESGEIISTPGGGRPGVGLALNPEGAFFIGAAINVEYLTVVELNLAAQIVTRLTEPVEANKDPETVFNQLVRLIERIRQANPLSQKRSRGIGLTIPGTLNHEGIVLRAPRLNWYGVDLRSYLQSQIDLPLFVDNDANAAALAEVYLGKAMQSNSLLYLLLNDGVGSGIIIHNRVFRGANGTAGEVCDLLVPQGNGGSEYGPPGSLGALVGRDGLLRRYQERKAEASDLDDLVKNLAQAEPLAQAVVYEWATRLGWGLTNLIKIINPERVVLGGPLTVLLPYVKDQLNTMLREYVPHNGIDGFFSNAKADFELSEFGEDSSAVGGACLVYQSLFQVPDLVLLEG